MTRRSSSPLAPTTKTIRITDIVQNEALQVRNRVDQGTVKRYASVYACGNKMPPVQVAVVNDAYVLTDGWHRLAALEQLGRTDVEAEVIPAKERDLAWLAAKANLAHGLPLKAKEYREVFRAFISSRQHLLENNELKSYREIAQELGGQRHYSTIRNWMMKDFPKIASRMAGQIEDAPGGSIEVEGDGFEGTAQTALEKAFAAFKAVGDPEARGRLIAFAERQIEDMKAYSPWTPWEDPEDHSPF